MPVLNSLGLDSIQFESKEEIIPLSGAKKCGQDLVKPIVLGAEQLHTFERLPQAAINCSNHRPLRTLRGIFHHLRPACGERDLACCDS